MFAAASTVIVLALYSVLGEQGFSPAHGTFQLLGYLFLLVWVVWLAVHAWRREERRGSEVASVGK